LDVSANVVASNSLPTGSASNLYEGLALVRQNMDMLMNQLKGGNGGAFAGANGNAAPLAAKIDQLSRSFAAETQKLEGKVAALEGENQKMKEQVNEQADEINEMLGGKRPHASHQSNTSKPTVMKTQSHAHKVHKSKGSATQKATHPALLWMKPGSYATNPWDVTFKVHVDGNAAMPQQSFTMRVHPEWAPEGAKRFQDMVRDGILDDARIFRVIPRFMVQFGIPGSPKVAAKWIKKKIPDDPVTQSNHYGTVSFAKAGRNSRTTQIFINTHPNDYLDKQGFAPFAEVLAPGMDLVEQFESKYKGKPNQRRVWKEGNEYLTKHFPGLSTISHVEVTQDDTTKAAGFLPKKQ
jgi:cyclophilin family peptidyl-prolyl cis-trans isomerase